MRHMPQPVSQNEVSSETIIRASPDSMVAEVQGEAVLLHLPTGKYFGLNEIATRVWRQIQTPTRLQVVIDDLVADYDVARSVLELDVLKLVRALEDAGLADREPPHSVDD